MENIRSFLKEAAQIMNGCSTDQECDDREIRITTLEGFYLDNITNKLFSMDKDTRIIFALRVLKTIDSTLCFCPIEEYEQLFYQKLGDVFWDFGISLSEIANKEHVISNPLGDSIDFTPYKKTIKDKNADQYVKGISLKRQVRAIHELLSLSGMPIDANRMAIAEFVQFLTGRNLGAKKLSDTNIYTELKRIKNTRKDRDSEKERLAYDSDIDFISDKFEKVGLGELANRLRNEKKE